ncbi:hypothetical protein C8J57DRAFT_1287803 [Mycena rebaudengoi]|nr:hypothetical protein C8J57DRAFT_1287803 [Mycena rebaudengoi]
MTDLTFSYLHMTHHDLIVLDTLETSDYLKGDIAQDDLVIPPHLVPPNPDDSDTLPSRTHPSYPYGDPTNVRHPASRPRPPYDPFSRALFEDMGYAGGGVNGTMRWKELAIGQLLPVDEAKEEARPGSSANPAPQQNMGQGAIGVVEEPENDENENDEDDEDDTDSDTDGEEY